MSKSKAVEVLGILELARRTGLSASQVSRIMSGESNGSVRALVAIAGACGCSLTELVVLLAKRKRAVPVPPAIPEGGNR